MAKTHDIGTKHFVQYLGFYPALWGLKVVVSGWTQEIADPYRTGKTLIVRLPFKRAVALGKWTGLKDEEEALNLAVQGRVLTDADFQEGWQPPAYQVGATSFEDWDV